MAAKIDPIFLTQDAATMLAATVDLTSALVQRAVDGETTTEQSIPARLTAYHAATDASNPTGFNFYDWTRQMYDPTGKRVDFIPTQTGGLNVPTTGNVFSPAIPIGTNTRVLQPSELPCEVMLDKRNANAKYGPVYEFTMPGKGGASLIGSFALIVPNTTDYINPAIFSTLSTGTYLLTGRLNLSWPQIITNQRLYNGLILLSLLGGGTVTPSNYSQNFDTPTPSTAAAPNLLFTISSVLSVTATSNVKLEVQAIAVPGQNPTLDISLTLLQIA